MASERFRANQAAFVRLFDELVRDLFKGEQLEALASDFLATNAEYLAQVPYTHSLRASRYPNCAELEALQEELRLLEAAARERPDEAAVSDAGRLAAEAYWRAAQAAYLGATLRQARQEGASEEADRARPLDETGAKLELEPLAMARQALRFDPHNFRACYWYMIALGWRAEHEDGSTRAAALRARERTLAAHTFHTAARRCIDMEPADWLAYNLLGRYYFRLAQLSRLERALARSLTGIQLEASLEASERELRRAHELKADWLPTGLWMARVLLARKRPMAEVRGWIEFGLNLSCLDPDSQIERRQLLELQTRLGLKN